MKTSTLMKPTWRDFITKIVPSCSFMCAGGIETLRVFSVFAFLFIFTFQIQAQTIDDIPIKLERLNDKALFIKTGETDAMTNILAVVSKEGLIVMDTGSLPVITQKVKKAIEKEFGRKDYAYLIYTHADLAHNVGGYLFPDAICIGHDNCTPLLKKLYDRFNNPRDPERLKNLMKDREVRLNTMEKGSYEEKLSWERAYNMVNLFKTIQSSDFKLILPDITFSGRLTLYLEDMTIHMIHNVDAYSDNDIMMYIPELKLLNVGDVFNKDRLPWLNSRTDIPKWLEIFKEFTDKEDEIDFVIGGHNGLMTMADVRENLAYIKDLYEGIKTAQIEGLSLEETKEKFAFEKFNHLSHVEHTFKVIQRLPGDKESKLVEVDRHERFIEDIWKRLKKKLSHPSG